VVRQNLLKKTNQSKIILNHGSDIRKTFELLRCVYIAFAKRKNRVNQAVG
jgi:hypothetical protein